MYTHQLLNCRPDGVAAAVAMFSLSMADYPAFVIFVITTNTPHLTPHTAACGASRRQTRAAAAP